MAYGVTLLAMLFTAFSYNAMVRRYPVIGSAYSYARLSFGANIGFLVGWALLLDYLFIPIINHLVVGIFLHQYFPMIPEWAFILAAITLVTLINILGIKSVSRFGNILIGMQFIFVAVFIVLAGITLLRHPQTDVIAPFYGDGSNDGMLPLLAGAAILCLSFLGFDAVSTLAEEARNPQRDIPRAVLIITLGAGVLFILLAALSQLVLPGIQFHNADAAANDVMLAVGGSRMVTLFTICYVAGACGSALASQAAVARILYGMGRDRILPGKMFVQLSDRFNSPIFALLFVSMVSLLALVLSLETLASVISFGALIAFLAVNLAVIKTYLLDTGLRTVRAWLQYGLLPLIGCMLTVWLWTSLSTLSWQLGLTWLVFGTIYLLVRPIPNEIAI